MKVAGTALLLLLAGSLAAAYEVTEIKLGQALWRAECTTAERTLPNGAKRAVQVDLFGLVMQQAADVRILLQAEGQLGLVVRALDRNDAQGNPALIGLRPAGRALEAKLEAGRYMLVVAGDPPGRGAYLLSVARPRELTDALPVTAEAGPSTVRCPFLGGFRLPAGVRYVNLSPNGRLLICGDGQQAWLFDLELRRGVRLPDGGEPVRRADLSPDGWGLMTVSERQAVLWALPDLVPYARFTAASGVRDAVFAGQHTRVAVLPVGSPVYVSSPVEGDLAFIPGSKGGTALVADAAGSGLLVRSGERDVALFDLASRQQLGRTTWPAPPRSLAVHPSDPLVVGGGPGANRAWRPGGTFAELPATEAVDFALNGALALGGHGVELRQGPEPLRLTPTVEVTALRFSLSGARLAALASDGRVLLWDTSAVAGTLQQDPLTEAKQAYAQGLQLLRKVQFAEAHEAFARSLEALQRLEAKGETVEFICLTLLRLSQCSYGAKDFQRSLSEAEDLLRWTARLPEGSLKRSNLAVGWYRKADALWELGRRDEARPAYKTALDHGLDGPAAEDARQKVQGGQ